MALNWKDAKPALVLAPETPYPLVGGGALRTASLIHYLAQTRPVDLIVFRQPGEPDPASKLPTGLVRRVSSICLPPTGRGALARAVRNSSRLVRRVPPLVDRFAGFESELAQLIGAQRYGVGLIEHSWCAPYLAQLAPACERTVLDLHNIESVLHHRSAGVERAAAAFAHRHFCKISQQLERTWLPRFSQVLVTSAQDAAAVRHLTPTARISVYPNAIPLTPMPERGRDQAIVFSGNMEYHPNITAVAFFRNEVWPQLRERFPSLVWRLIGKNEHAVRRFTAGDERIEVTGPVDDAIAELARGRVAIVPLLSGSGTRFKILEAWSAGVPVVSTAVGAEGLPVRDGEQLLLADGAPAFAVAVIRALEDSPLADRLSAAGRLLLEQAFTWDAVWKNLDL